jgi:F0F1-type ATP synthase membrane subunit b/b'
MAFIKRKKKVPDFTFKKKVPLLTLDQRWHELFPKDKKNRRIIELENKLNELIREQGQTNNDFKEYTLLKKRMLSDIMDNMSDAIDYNDKDASKLLEKNKQYISEINEKLEKYDNKLDEIPSKIQQVNEELFKECAEICYTTMEDNKKEIENLEVWIEETKNLLKEKIIKKQEMQEVNSKIYSYMHDLVGLEIVNYLDKDFGEEND